MNALMTSPQLENGYTRIANEIMEAFARIRIQGEARQILDVILRKTYGFGKKKDWIALDQFNKMTGLDQGSVCRAIRRLVAMKIVVKERGQIGSIYSLQKDYSKWQVALLPHGEIANQGVAKRHKKGVAKLPHTKETLQKKLLQKKDMQKKVEGKISSKDMNDIYRVVEAFKPVNKFWHTLENNPKQMDAAWRMIQVAGVDAVLRVIAILPKTNKIPYVANISSPVKLEEKWSDLEAQLRKLKATDDATKKKKPKVIFS